MENRYTIEVLAYDGRTSQQTIEADDIQIKNGVIKFVSDCGHKWIPIAVYPADKTIVSKIEILGK
jgi:hypothetical protein